MNANLQDIMPKSFATHMLERMKRREAFESAGIDMDDFHSANDPIFDKMNNANLN